MKKVFIAVLTLALAAFLAAGCGGDTKSQAGDGQVSGVQAKEIRVATQPTPNIAPIFVAKQKGWLEEEMAKVGVAVKWTSFLSGPPMNESFAAGEQDVGFLGDTAAIIPRSAGQDLRVVSMAAVAPKALAIVVPKDSPITSPQELKGKKVATVKGSYAHHLLSLVLKNNGLTTEDIQFINLPIADVATALVKGDIAAGAVWEPQITKLEDDGAARVLVDGTGIKNGSIVIVASDGFAVKNPELVKIFIKVYQRGYEFIKDNPREAAELIAGEAKLTPEQLVKVLPKFDFDPGLQAEDVEELVKSEVFMREAGITKTQVDIDAFIDDSYLRSAGI